MAVNEFAIDAHFFGVLGHSAVLAFESSKGTNPSIYRLLHKKAFSLTPFL